jgi:hypothetical protein
MGVSHEITRAERTMIAWTTTATRGSRVQTPILSSSMRAQQGPTCKAAYANPERQRE